jgi:hypothetical protein
LSANSLGFVRDLLGICLGFVWDLSANSLGFVRECTVRPTRKQTQSLTKTPQEPNLDSTMQSKGGENNSEMGDKKHLWVTKILRGFCDDFCRKNAFLFRDFFIMFFY